jgi:hypothetical protein
VKAAPAGEGGGTVTLTIRQLLINQRISQAAVRRTNALKARLDGGLTGGDVRDGAITPNKLARGLTVVSAKDGATAPKRSVTRLAPRRSEGGRVTLTSRQLRINQRISQAAVRRANALRLRLERGLTSADFQPRTLSAADLASELRKPPVAP